MQPTSDSNITRRKLMTTASTAAGAMAIASVAPARAAEKVEEKLAALDTGPLKGKLRQSVCQWCYRSLSVEELAAGAKKIGLVGIDLVGPDTFPILKKYGLIGTMTPSHPIDPGLNRVENHEKFLPMIRKSIEATADAGFPNVICFSGNRKGMDDQEGMKNCATALKQVVGLAEQKKVTICMELLNSKRNHKDYMCDRTPWGVELVKMVGSDRFKLLYDIYHMQIDEGDVIATIRENKDYIGHYHTGGVPGRNEIDESQELFYPAIAKAIVDMGYTGILAHEFIPKRDPLTSLAQGARICDVS